MICAGCGRQLSGHAPGCDGVAFDRAVARFATVTFPWNGIRWTIDYTAIADGENWRGKLSIVEAHRERTRDGSSEVSREEMVALVEARPGELERKASGYAKKLLFGDDHASVRVRRLPSKNVVHAPGTDSRIRPFLET